MTSRWIRPGKPAALYQPRWLRNLRADSEKGAFWRKLVGVEPVGGIANTEVIEFHELQMCKMCTISKVLVHPGTVPSQDADGLKRF
jgi:hypothetical protein